MSETGRRWFVVQSHVHGERKAAWHLARQGFETYVPRYLKRRRHARKTDTVAAPVFPRYLFVCVDMNAPGWSSIRSTVGVSTLVCNGNIPASVPDGVVAALKSRENDDGYLTFNSRPQFAAGAPVRILDGAFAACIGLFDELRDNDRVAVLLDLLGRKVRVLVDDLSLAAA